MNRRHFVVTAGLALGGCPVSGVVGAAALPHAGAPSTGLRIRLGCQSGPMDDAHLEFLKRHSVEAVCGAPPTPRQTAVWTAAELTDWRARVERHGLVLEMVPAPFLESVHVDRNRRAAIVLGQSPERDRDIEEIQILIRNCAQAGIPAIKHNLSLLGVLRTASTAGRGGSRLGTWRLAEAGPRATQLTRAGRIPADLFWERITYFLERVIPVATEHRVRMACHPHDPGVPAGFAGVDCVLGTVEGLKRFVSICESPYHGLDFCQGTICEMLEKPAEQIFDVIRYFGERGKIFNVHFRNIRGHRDDFQETFPDDGDVDMRRALLTYREVGYPYLVMPNHVPQHGDDPAGHQAFAFCYGHLRGLLQSM
jgi:mannonate dehydratase